jgi:hypothetical protein
LPKSHSFTAEESKINKVWCKYKNFPPVLSSHEN